MFRFMCKYMKKSNVREHMQFFAVIEFAIFCRPFETENLMTFERIIGKSYDKNDTT